MRTWLVTGYSLAPLVEGYVRGVYLAATAENARQAFRLAYGPCVVWYVNDLDPGAYPDVVALANQGATYANVAEAYAQHFYHPYWDDLLPDFDKWWHQRSCKTQNERVM